MDDDRNNIPGNGHREENRMICGTMDNEREKTGITFREMNIEYYYYRRMEYYG